MNIIASTVSPVVDDVDASSRFFTTHLGFREAMNAEGFVSHSRGTSTTGPLRQGKRPPQSLPNVPRHNERRGSHNRPRRRSY
ncbi:hypothetical protein OHA77_14990 [Streptosporangium sp. NBC_01639]|uniref:hypothetical protein n=1 Tax=unclassified Streptosporangium TaxID=2632669 RepID=UPI002DDB0504|nr:hypothetical protein [Streptosporangium sp. NBC_01756]WSC83610.1 hypothetical protein OIE48_24770 [Streptosporangium sp. NBC_01756]WTD57783.1 hypothetical protein OHA77_14990 [Streptosporangium sp. NBC_01639]